MSNAISNKNKIIKSFSVIGLNESLIQKYDDIEIPDFIENIDILVKQLPYHSEIYKPETGDEKWIRVLKDKNIWLRIKYTKEYRNPITAFKAAECEYESPEFLLLEKKHIDDLYRPIMVTVCKDYNNNESFPIIKEFEFYKPYNEFYVKIPSEFDIKDIMNLPNKSKASVLLISRNLNSLPLKEIIIQRKKNSSLYTFGISRHKSPYTFKYMPEILDNYPINNDVNNGISLFCFPEGISIKDKYEMPKWFSFVLTDEVGERTYGTTVIFLEDDKKLIESFIPIYKEEDAKNSNKQKLYFFPKAICVLSRYPFFHNCKLFLRELYRLQVASKPKIPLERAICAFVDTLYLQPNDSILRFLINEEKLDFYRIPNYGELWDTNNNYLEVMFRVLSFQQIITAWQGLLLEKKLFLLCSSKSTLLAVAFGLINLLFPFKWIHVFVPILPEKLKVFIDSPVPLIVGISYSIDLNELPNDALILNINKNRFENYYEKMPKLPGKINLVLEKKLAKLKEKYAIDNPINVDKWMDYQDEVTPAFELEKHLKIDTTEIRDVFYDVFVHIFKNYLKYFDWNNKEKIVSEEETTTVKFLKNVFLKDHSSQEENSFLALFCETALFSQLESAFSVIKVEKDITFFINSIKNGRGEHKVYLPDIIPQKIVMAPQIDIKDIGNRDLFHKLFPKLDPTLFIDCKEVEKVYHKKFIYYEDEWCYDINKLKKKDLIKYFIYSIHEIWFYFFSFIIHFYQDKDALIFMDFAVSLLEDLINNKKISPTRNLFAKIFKSAARNELAIYVKKILILANQVNKGSKYTKLFHNQYLTGLYALTENIGPNNTIAMATANSYLNITSMRNTIMSEISANDYDNINLLNSFIFLNYKICGNCAKNKKYKKIFIEEILSGLLKNSNYIICPECFEKMDSAMYFLKNTQYNLNINKFKLLSPFILKNQIDNLLKEFSDIAFYKRIPSDNILLSTVYLNIIYYFQLFDLPLFVLYIPKNSNITDELIFSLNENKARRNFLVTKRKKSGVSVSPDRKNKSQLDTSSDNKSNTGDGSSIFSGKSTISNLPAMETEIFKIILKFCENTNGEKINPSEKSEYISRLKEMKIGINKIIQYFLNLSKEKLETFLNERDNIKQESQLGEIHFLKQKNTNNITQLKDNKNSRNINESDNKIPSNNKNINNDEVENIRTFSIEDMNTMNSMNFGGISEIREESKDENIKKNINNTNIKTNDNNKQNIDINRKNTIEISIKKNIATNNDNNKKNNDNNNYDEKDFIGHALTHNNYKNPISLREDKKATDKNNGNSNQNINRYGSISSNDSGLEIKKSKKKKIKIIREDFVDKDS